MQVIQIVPELSPFTGHSRRAVVLEQFILNLNHTHAFTIMPWYDKIKIPDNQLKAVSHFKSVSIYETNIPSTDSVVYLIKPLKDHFLFDSFKEDSESIILFSLSAIEFIQSLDNKYIVQCHDAETGLIPLLLKDNKGTETFSSLFTIHDLAIDIPIYHEELNKLIISEFYLNEMHGFSADSTIKIAILFSSIINVSSKQYSYEIQTESFADAYQKLLQYRSADLYGIMNGVRYGIWNPSIDTFIPCKYSSDNITGRFYNKLILQDKLTLPDQEEIPLFFFGTRLCENKGLDLLIESLDELKELPLQLLIYGIGDEDLDNSLEEKISNIANIRYLNNYDEEFVHFILAGSDFILLPTKIEPDGISFLYALKYGIIPIAYKTGGHVDAIYDQTCGDSNKVNGFFFNSYDSASFISVIKEAIDCYSDKMLMDRYIKNAINADWSWKACVRQYEVLFNKLAEKMK